MKAVNAWIRNRDLFGQDVKIYFNRKRKTHNTTIGGIFSIILRIWFAIYLGIHIGKIDKPEEDKVKVTEKRLDLMAAENEVMFSDMKFDVVYAVLYDFLFTPYDDEIKKYITFTS